MLSLNRGIKNDGSFIDYRIYYHISKGISKNIAEV